MCFAADLEIMYIRQVRRVCFQKISKPGLWKGRDVNNLPCRTLTLSQEKGIPRATRWSAPPSTTHRRPSGERYSVACPRGRALPLKVR